MSQNTSTKQVLNTSLYADEQISEWLQTLITNQAASVEETLYEMVGENEKELERIIRILREDYPDVAGITGFFRDLFLHVAQHKIISGKVKRQKIESR